MKKKKTKKQKTKNEKTQGIVLKTATISFQKNYELFYLCGFKI